MRFIQNVKQETKDVFFDDDALDARTSQHSTQGVCQGSVVKL